MTQRATPGKDSKMHVGGTSLQLPPYPDAFVGAGWFGASWCWCSRRLTFLDMAGAEAEPGRDMPTASLNAAIVLAVNMPPHVPGHGVAYFSTSCSSSMSMSPPE